MKLVLSVPSTSNSVTLEEMKHYLRVLHTKDDEMITSMITQSSQRAESIMNRQIMPCTYELYFDVMQDEITLPRPPFMSLESFQVFDGDTWNDISEYQLDDKSTPAVLYPTSWPLISSDINSVKIVYKAGWASASDVFETIKQWIKIQVSTYYANREAFVIGANVSELPASHVDSLVKRHRIHNL